MKDTKLISNYCRLITEGESSISAKRIRSDDCRLQSVNGDISIGSYVESGMVEISSINGNIKISKKVGINEKGLIKTNQGKIDIGVIYSNMANLPPPTLANMSQSAQID